jgi:hypothetical protein
MITHEWVLAYCERHGFKPSPVISTWQYNGEAPKILHVTNSNRLYGHPNWDLADLSGLGGWGGVAWNIETGEMRRYDQ